MNSVIASNAPGRKTYVTPGGVHPEQNKQQSLQTPIKTATIAEELTLPLSQHIGAPAKAIVAVGDKVLKGQLIAEANGFVSVPVHASTSGEIIAIEDRLIIHASGMTAPCIILKPDGKDLWIDHQGVEDFTQLEKSQLLAIIRQAGIAGMGGAGFPTAVKLNTGDGQTIQSLILNGTECEPYITADDILMRERSEQIIQGALILQHIIQPSQETIIGVEDNKPEAIAALREAAKGTNIEIVAFITKYPSGGEKQLIQILTGKEVPSGGLPADIGIVCQNIGSAVAVYKAVVHGEPLISRITTVTGNAVEQQQNYEVLLGTPFRHLLALSGFDDNKAVRLISGGPMMGFTTQSDSVPVIKATNCILAPTAKELPPPPPAQACIRCGMCAEACPASLLPQQMYWFAQSKNHEALMQHNLMDCIECGACSFACPSNIPLVQYYRASKADIRQANEEAKKAEYSMQRFEAREARLAKAEAEKEAKRKERQEKAAAAAKAKALAAEKTQSQPSVSADPVQAAIDRAQAKASGQSDPSADINAKISSLEKRITKAGVKLEQAKQSHDENLPAFEKSLQNLNNKLSEAKAELLKLNASDDKLIKFDGKADNNSPQSAEAFDPVQAAIDRAKAKASGKSDPIADIHAKINSLEKRIIKADTKLEQAKQSHDENLPAFEKSLQNLNNKLSEAKAELAKLSANNTVAVAKKAHQDLKPQTTTNDTDVDPVQAAIDRAKAKRSGDSTDEDPKTKLINEVSSLTKRIDNAQKKLSAAAAVNPTKADALKTSIEKLQVKLNSAEKALNELN